MAWERKYGGSCEITADAILTVITLLLSACIVGLRCNTTSNLSLWMLLSNACGHLAACAQQYIEWIPILGFVFEFVWSWHWFQCRVLKITWWRSIPANLKALLPFAYNDHQILYRLNFIQLKPILCSLRFNKLKHLVWKKTRHYANIFIQYQALKQPTGFNYCVIQVGQRFQRNFELSGTSN